MTKIFIVLPANYKPWLAELYKGPVPKPKRTDIISI